MGPPLQIQSRSIGSGPGPPLQGQKLRFGRGPPLQGDFVRRVVARPAPTRGRGTSMYRSDEIPLQRRPSRPWFSPFRRTFPSTSPSRHRRSHGHPSGERRGGAGIGRKQAMDGLRSPVGARDGATRRCARSPHCRGSTRSRKLQCFETALPWLHPQPRDSGTFQHGRIRYLPLGRKAKKKPQPLPVGVLSFGGGGRSRTAVRRHSISGTTCLAHRWVSSRGSTACEAHPGTSLFWVDRALTGNHSRRSCDDDPTSTSTGTSGFGATP